MVRQQPKLPSTLIMKCEYPFGCDSKADVVFSQKGVKNADPTPLCNKHWRHWFNDQERGDMMATERADYLNEKLRHKNTREGSLKQ